MPVPEPGSQLDHYALEELIASSTTASIFRATDVRTGQPVAIKLPHPEVEGDLVFYNRFLRAQDICEKLDHPAVVKAIRDDRRSQIYLPMEFAAGQPLRHVLHERGKLPPDRAVRIAVAICEALEYIHTQGVVHRDLKPENIMIDAEDRIKIIDFGIASQAGARRLTFGKLSQVMGTPDYIAPEQVKGKRGDARTDVYALGVMLYEMLTGKVPFPGENPFVSMNDRLVKDPIPPREIDPSVGPELQEIVYRAMARDPKDRYPSAREFANHLLHPEQAPAAARPAIRKAQSAQVPRSVLFYGLLAMVPVIILGLLLLAAHHG